MRRIVRLCAPFGVMLLAVVVVMDPASFTEGVLAQTASFLETFDGTPAVPTDYANPHNWDIYVNGFNDLEPSVGQHGPSCDPPGFPYNSANTHPLHTSSDAVYICNNHVMTSPGITGYGAIYMTPPALMSLNGGTAVLRWDMSTLRTSSRDWVDVVLNPYNEHQVLAYNNGGFHVPPDNVHVELQGVNGFRVSERVAGGDDVYLPSNGSFTWDQVQAVNGLTEDAARRDTFEIDLSTTHVRICMVGNNTGQTYTFQGHTGFCWVDADLPTPLSPSVWGNQAQVEFNHRVYNAEKACSDQEDEHNIVHNPTGDANCPPNTWHWDNVSINPAVPYSIIKPTQDVSLSDPGPQTVTFQQPAPPNTNLEFVTFGTNSALQVSFDGGRTWQAAQFQPATAAGHDENGEMVWMRVPTGISSVVVRGANGFWGTYQSNGFNLVSATAGVVIPTLTPTPVGGGGQNGLNTPTPTPTQGRAAATPTNTPVPTSTSTPTATPTPTRPFSLALDGQTGYADVPGGTGLALSGDWTVETWFKDDDPAGFNHLYRTLLDKGDGVVDAPYAVLVGNGNILASVRSGGTNFAVTFSLGQAHAHADEWHHVAVTFRADSRTATLYLDGNAVAQQTLGGQVPTGAQPPLQLGRQGPTSGKEWLGKLADIRIWSIVRDPADIQANFRQELVSIPAGLVANWRFHEGGGTTAADSVSPSNRAYLHGGASFSTDSPLSGATGAAATGAAVRVSQGPAQLGAAGVVNRAQRLNRPAGGR